MIGRSTDVLLSLLEGHAATPGRIRLASKAFGAGLRATWAEGALRDLQRSRLAETLAYAADRSPYYREAFPGTFPERRREAWDGPAAEAALAALPFTAPGDVRDWRRFLCVPERELSAVYTTSGTAGEPKIVGFTWGDLQRLTNLWALGMHLENPALLRALIALPTMHGLWIGTASATRGIERAGGLPLPIGTPHPSEALDWMRRLAPTTVVSSPSYLTALTRQAEAEGYRPALEGITLGGEPLDPARRQRFAESWSARVTESYGATEIGGPQTIALPGCRGLHLNELQLFTEIVEPGGDAPAEEGDLVFTTLKREAMPLVRYRIGDRARWVACECGLPLRCIQLTGRGDDQVTVGGTHLYAQVVADQVAPLAGGSGRVELVLEREDLRDRLTVRVEGDRVERRAIREAVFEAYPRLAEVVAGELIRFEAEVGADLSGQIKGVRVRDLRA